MKKIVTMITLAILISAISFIPSYSYDKYHLVGTWETVMTQNMTTGKKYTPKSKTYLEFYEDGSMVMTDTGERKKTSWKWHLRKGRLYLLSDHQERKGTIKFFSIQTDRDSPKIERFTFLFSNFEQKMVKGRMKTFKIGTYKWTFEK